MNRAGKLGIILAATLITGCSTAVDRTQAGFGDAAMAPLTELNLRRTEVPPLLVAPRPRQPEAQPPVEVRQLEAALAPRQQQKPARRPPRHSRRAKVAHRQRALTVAGLSPRAAAAVLPVGTLRGPR